MVGGSVAALVAADAAARAGHEVDLYLPRKGAGGGFAPIEMRGRRLERGIRVLELAFEDDAEPPPIERYRPDVYGHRPYARLLWAYVAELVGDRLHELGRPKMFLNGRMREEIHLTVDLTRLRESLTAEQAAAVAAEAGEAMEVAGPAGVLDPARQDELRSLPFDVASLTNHGATFHGLLIEPLCRKIRPQGAEGVPAALRRKLWMPLFHPRTLWEAAGGAEVGFRAHRPFHTVTPGGPGEIVTALVERLVADARVEVTRIDKLERVEPGGGATALELEGAGRIVADRPVIGVAPGELFAAAGIAYAPDRVHSALLWLEVAEDDLLDLPSFAHVVDPGLRVFRLTPGERDAETGRRILCLEMSHDVEEAEAPEAGRAALELMGVIRPGAETEVLAFFAGPTFTAPTMESAAKFATAREALAAREVDAEVIGGAETFGADALNDQILQGLRAAALRA